MGEPLPKSNKSSILSFNLFILVILEAILIRDSGHRFGLMRYVLISQIPRSGMSKFNRWDLYILSPITQSSISANPLWKQTLYSPIWALFVQYNGRLSHLHGYAPNSTIQKRTIFTMRLKPIFSKTLGSLESGLSRGFCYLVTLG